MSNAPDDNRWARARNVVPPADGFEACGPDPFAFLERRFARQDWPFVLGRFHAGCRCATAHPAEIVAWTLRDLRSVLRDVGGLDRYHLLWRLHHDRSRALLEAIERHPDEARLLAVYVAEIEFCAETRREITDEGRRRKQGGTQ